MELTGGVGRHEALGLGRDVRSLLGCADRVQEVGVFAKTGAILVDLIRQLPLALELLFPPARVVGRLRSLKSVKNGSIAVSNSGDFFDSHGPIKRVISVQPRRIRLWLLCGSGRCHSLRLLEVDLEHLSQQDPVLVLNLAHAFCAKAFTVIIGKEQRGRTTYPGSASLASHCSSNAFASSEL